MKLKLDSKETVTEVKHLETPLNVKENKPKLSAPKVTPAVKIENNRNKNTMKESRLEVKHGKSEENDPGNTLM